MKKKSGEYVATKDSMTTKDSVTRHFLERPMKMEEYLENEQDSLENLKSMICSTTSHLSAAPSGNRNVHARESLIAKKMDLEKQIEADKDKLEEMKAEVILAIMTLKDPNQQSAIRYRYLEGCTNWEAANKMCVDVRSVQRYVQAGCQAMRLPDRYYKKKTATASGAESTGSSSENTGAGEKDVASGSESTGSGEKDTAPGKGNTAPDGKDETAA